MKKVIIIGAGILGASAAYRLAKQGASVILVDRNEPGQATDAAAGIICPWLAQRRNKAWYELVKQGARLYPELINELANDGEINTGYKKVGAIRLHTDTDKLLATKERILKRREDAPEIGDVHLLNKQETGKLFPLVDPIYQSLYITGGARVNGHLLRTALLRAAKRYGAEMIDGDARLVREGEDIIGIRTNDQLIKSDMVIATTGAWMAELFEPLGISFLARPQKAQIMHLQLTSMNTNDWPVIMPPNNQYILPFTDNKIIIGATHESKAGFDHRVTAGGAHEILTKALQIAPGLSASTLIETKVGFRPFTPNSVPVIGSIPGLNKLLVANGLGASGLTMGPYIGDQLAKLALNIEPDIDLTQYEVTKVINQN